eukprot:COSAG06_NODE_19828_length_820_cov_1.685160_1_plen_96_part_10
MVDSQFATVVALTLNCCIECAADPGKRECILEEATAADCLPSSVVLRLGLSNRSTSSSSSGSKKFTERNETGDTLPIHARKDHRLLIMRTRGSQRQ